MTLERKIIRNKCKELLLGRTAAGDSVFINRSNPFWHENLPSISIYTRTESNIEQFSQQPRQYKRFLELGIEIVVAGETEEIATDRLDELAAEIEDVLTTDHTLDCTASDIEISSVQMEFEHNGEQVNGFCTLRFEVLYLRTSPASNRFLEALVDFEGANVDYMVNGSDEISATDEIEVMP